MMMRDVQQIRMRAFQRLQDQVTSVGVDANLGDLMVAAIALVEWVTTGVPPTEEAA